MYTASPNRDRPFTLPIAGSDCPKHPSSGSNNAPTTNFSLSHVQQQNTEQSGVTTCSRSKRRREGFESSISDSQGRKKIVAPTLPLHYTQVPTCVAKGTNLIDSSTATPPTLLTVLLLSSRRQICLICNRTTCAKTSRLVLLTYISPLLTVTPPSVLTQSLPLLFLVPSSLSPHTTRSSLGSYSKSWM